MEIFSLKENNEFVKVLQWYLFKIRFCTLAKVLKYFISLCYTHIHKLIITERKYQPFGSEKSRVSHKSFLIKTNPSLR